MDQGAPSGFLDLFYNVGDGTQIPVKDKYDIDVTGKASVQSRVVLDGSYNRRSLDLV
jgi:hypothetical protein